MNRTSRRAFLRAACAAPAILRSAPAPRPNVVFILADDLGWGDLHCYGHRQIRTPNLDRLAAQGTLFTQFYVANPVCSPSRTGFMTGHFPARHKVHGHFAAPDINARRGMPNFLDPAVAMLPRQMKEAGYATGHFGKWHLGNGPGAPPPGAYGVDDHRTYASSNAPTFAQEPDYWAHLCERIADESIRFIGENRARPFYLNVWTNLVHAPVAPTDEQMKPYAQFAAGADKFGATRRFTSTLQVYYSAVSELDKQVGRILQKLEEAGVADNTIVAFSSDNGPEDIHLVETSHSGVGSAGPFRGRKRSIYEGGVRLPYVVRWPGHVPAGRVDDRSVLSSLDFLPSMGKLTGAKIPENWKLDGEDMSDVLLGESRPRRTALYWEWRFNILGDTMHRSPMLAVRDGDHKLLFNPDQSRTELYDIPRDPWESDNLAERKPEVVARLREKAVAWQKTLPGGPMEPGAGKRDYPWPQASPAAH